MTTYAALAPMPLEVAPGGDVSCDLTVRNNGDIVEGYRLEVLGDGASWASVDPPMVSLYPGAESTVRVAFRPPRSSLVPAGQVPFTVLVSPTERPDEAVAPEGVVNVLPFTDTTAEIIPQTSSTRRSARHELAVDNRGNIPITAMIATSDPDGRLTFRSQPSALTVLPGQAEFAAVRVRHRRLLWRGNAVTRPFQVVVTSEGERPTTLNAASVQTAVIPRSAPKVLAAVVALAALASAAWFMLLKPAVQSAAKEAVSQPLTRVSQQAETANRKADVAGQKADSAVQAMTGSIAPSLAPPPAVPPSPKPSASGAPAVAGQPARPGDVSANSTSSPARVRLQATVAAGPNPGTASFTVAARTTLTVTDLFLENPQGDTGRVDVLVDGTPILTLSLANFRDMDYHFVSPIEVGTGKTLSIATTCQAPGPALAGTTGGARCRTLLLADGVNWVTPATTTGNG